VSWEAEKAAVRGRVQTGLEKGNLYGYCEPKDIWFIIGQLDYYAGVEARYEALVADVRQLANNAGIRLEIH